MKKRSKGTGENPVKVADRVVRLFLIFCIVVGASATVGIVLLAIGALWQIVF